MNNRGRLVVDILLGVVAAILVLVLTPGLGFVAILIGVVLVVCLISFAVGAAIRRWRGHSGPTDARQPPQPVPPVRPDARPTRRR